MRSGEETRQSLTSCCQSSSAPRSQGKSVVAIELEMVSLRGDAAPGAQVRASRETNASPTPEASAKTSHDFSSGACKWVSDRHRSFLVGLACQQADLTFASGWAGQTGQRSRFRETGFPQHRFPLRSLE